MADEAPDLIENAPPHLPRGHREERRGLALKHVRDDGGDCAAIL